MDTGRLLELAPHYVAMLLLVFLTLTVVRTVAGEISFWIELGIVVIIAAAYRPLVIRLGIAPSSWER